jgi:hypothetical protein
MVAFVVVGLVVALILGGVHAARQPDLARISASAQEIRVVPIGLMKVLALHLGLRIPPDHVTAAYPVSRPQERYSPGARLPGTWLPGLLAGSFQGAEGRSFWVVGTGENAVRIDLQDDHYDYVVVDVDDPAAAVRAITAARSGRSGERP